MGVGFQELRLHMLLHAQLCWTLCDPKDCSLPGSFVHGISQTRILELPVFLLQGIFPTQGWNPCLLCLLPWQVDSLPLVPPWNPKISHAEQPKKKKRGFLIKDSFFTDLAKREMVIREMFRRIKWRTLFYPTALSDLHVLASASSLRINC